MVGIPILIVLLSIIIFLLIIMFYEKYIGKSLSNKISKLEFLSVLSFVWILTIITLSSKEESSIKLNEWGDFLAGFFAPVLFIWLVYGVFLQKEEFGKMVDSFELQQKDFNNSLTTMKEQVVQVEIQHLNTWFNRNIRTINFIKATLLDNVNVDKVDSIALINSTLKKDLLTMEKHYFNIFDELKSILDVVLYMQEYLDNMENKEEEKEIFLNSVKELKKEFEMLHGEDIKNIKEIMTIAYILIASRTDTNVYKKYEIYQDWYPSPRDIHNLLLNTAGEGLNDKLLEIVKSISTLSKQMDFKTGEIRGSI